MSELGDALKNDPPPAPNEAEAETGLIGFRRDRLLASLNLLFGLALALAAPFALRYGREFFLPTTAAGDRHRLVPLLEWLERRRVPSCWRPCCACWCCCASPTRRSRPS
jgi:hypothetical protein